MNYLQTYLNYINAKNPAFAKSIKKTASEIGTKYLENFDFNSHQMGLLFGNVQSGKTGHVFGIMSKAVELGFQFFLMLTTDITDLQKQTFERAKRDLEDNNDFIVCGEKDEQKFRNHGNHPVVVVLKKNSRILHEWANKFKNMGDLKGNPLFIIDDEADAASLNTRINVHSKDINKQYSAINKYLRQINELSQSSIYLQMTGTPQSLILQSIDSGWKPMFIYYFAPGSGYLGGNFFFPNTDEAPDFVRFVDDDTDEETVHKVIIRHLVVSAQLFLSGETVSNCLIHPSVKQDVHKEVKNQFEKEFAQIAFNHAKREFQDELKREYDSIHPRKSKKQNFSAVKDKVLEMLEQHEYKITMLNSSSSDTADECKTGCNFVIGGNSLGRGVTFSELNTFYYTRSSKTPQADTMWQQSRIFGYDRDAGLVSLFIPRELYGLFAQINDTNDLIIKQVEKGETPVISYSEGLKPTRLSVVDKSQLQVVAGGQNYFPANPQNNTYEQISDLVNKFGDHDEPTEVPIGLLIEILKHFKTDQNFKLSSYISMMESAFNKDSLAKGRLFVRRNRNITFGKRALLSPNDWKTTNAFTSSFVLTLYQINGHDPSLKWPKKEDLWVPNIKLPGKNNFYII